jgi:hypothetical protein
MTSQSLQRAGRFWPFHWLYAPVVPVRFSKLPAVSRHTAEYEARSPCAKCRLPVALGYGIQLESTLTTLSGWAGSFVRR